ncbi:hypothetical protein D3C80_251350 [compost metagenome]
MEVIKRWIDESDVYMLILGGRYGSVETATGVSYTELEYDYARQQSKPIFSVVITEEALAERVKKHGATVIETNYPNELKQFREKVLTLMCAFYSDIKDIKLSIHESMAEYKNDISLKGWVSYDRLKDNAALSDEVNRLLNENVALKKQLESSEIPSKNKLEYRENYTDLMRIMKSVNVNIPEVILDEYVINEKNLFNVSYRFINRLTTGVTNKAAGATDLSRFLYFNIFPKLQLHGLATTESVPGVSYRRAYLTEKGLNFFASYEAEKTFANEE